MPDMLRFVAVLRRPGICAITMAVVDLSCGGGNPVSPVTPLPAAGPPSPYEVVADFYDGTLTISVPKDQDGDPCNSSGAVHAGERWTYRIQAIRADTMLLITDNDLGGYSATTDGHTFEIVSADYGGFVCGAGGERVFPSLAVTGTIASGFTGLTGHALTQYKRGDGTVAWQQELDWSADWTYRSTGPCTVQPYPYQPTPPPVSPDS